MAAGGFHFVAVPGSLRHGSFTRAIAASLDEFAPDDVAVEVFGGLAELPPYDQDVQDRGFPDVVQAFGAMLAAADAVVVVSPEYNHSVSGVLKNGLDWISRLPTPPLAGKPVAIQTASPGFLGGARAHEHVRQVLVAMDAVVLNRPEVIVTQAGSKVDVEAGVLRDDGLRDQIARQLAALSGLVRLRLPRAA